MSHTRLFYSKATGTHPYSSWPMNPYWKHLESGRCLVHWNLVCTILLGSIALQFVHANKNKMNYTETWRNGEAQILKQKIGDTNMHGIPVQGIKAFLRRPAPACLGPPGDVRGESVSGNHMVKPHERVKVHSASPPLFPSSEALLEFFVFPCSWSTTLVR
jgi:hypothetical protein